MIFYRSLAAPSTTWIACYYAILLLYEDDASTYKSQTSIVPFVHVFTFLQQ